MKEPGNTRRRGARLQAAILDAVWAELAEVGYANLTVAAVADRAGTSKAVLYRRWPGRAELVLAALIHNRAAVRTDFDTGSLRSDLLTLLTRVRTATGKLEPETVWGLLADTARRPELGVIVRSEFFEQSLLEPLSVIMKRAEDRGEIVRKPLTARLLALPVDLMRTEFLKNGSISQGAIREIIDEIVLPLIQRVG